MATDSDTPIAVLIKKGWLGIAAPRMAKALTIEQKAALEPGIFIGVADLISRGWHWRLESLLDRLTDNYWRATIPSLAEKFIIYGNALLDDRGDRLLIADNGDQGISVHFRGRHWNSPSAAFDYFRESERSNSSYERIGRMGLPLIEICGEAVERNIQNPNEFPAAMPALRKLIAVAERVPSRPFKVMVRNSLTPEVQALLQQ